MSWLSDKISKPPGITAELKNQLFPTASATPPAAVAASTVQPPASVTALSLTPQVALLIGGGVLLALIVARR